MVRHRWKIGAGVAAVALGGLYLYYRNQGGSGTTALLEAPQQTPEQLAQTAQQSLQSATPMAVKDAVEKAEPSLLKQLGVQTWDAALNEAVDVMVGNPIPSITRGTVQALREGLDAASALDKAVPDPTHFALG